MTTPTPKRRFIESLLPGLLRGIAETLRLNAPGKFTDEQAVCEQSSERIEQLQRDLAAREEELKAIAHHVGGGAFYRDEHGGRLPMRDQVGQHIAELNQQLADREAELARLNAIPQIHSDQPWKDRALSAEAELARVKAEREEAVRDGARWRKYLEIHDTEELAAAAWVGASEITKVIDAAIGRKPE